MDSILKMLVILVVTLITSSCGTQLVKDGKNLTTKLEIPKGWTKTTSKVVSPEGDLKVYFYKKKLNSNFDFVKESSSLWKTIDPNFSYEIKAESSPPNSKGWDKVTQIVYDTPAEQSKIIISLLREKNGIAYLNLIESSMATISKRGPQLFTVIDSWKPNSLPNDDYSNKKATMFDNKLEAQLDDFLTKTKNDLNIPGFAIGIIQDGKIVYKKGFGYTKVRDGSKVDSDTLFMIGSTTKSLSTLLMSKLITDGKMSWEDRVSLHLTDWRLKNKEDSEMMLMKHTACACTGMPRRDFDFIFEIEGVSAEQRMRQMQGMAPTTKPGETFQYSNYLVAAGGFAAAKAYDKKLGLKEGFNQAMKSLVFNPLQMKRSVVLNNRPYRKNSASPHSLNLDLKSEFVSLKLEEFVNSVAPAGSVWSNVDDMIKYLQYELSNGDQYPDYISKDALMLRRHKGVKITENLSYGLGLFVENNKGIEIIHHGGNTLGFTSDMFFIPSKGIGVVTLINQGDADVFRSSVKLKLLEMFFGMDNKVDEVISYSKKQSLKGIKKLKETLSPTVANKEKFLGKYKSENLGEMNIYTKSGEMIADFGEFKTVLAQKRSSGKKKVFVMMSPPWIGSLELIYDKKEFMLDGGQKKYYFKK
ncbi:serine hydrolase [Halobacteriovorax sp. GB3]|uniref:serine hydrolase domain-containing protein n=1 Tax=Halobacteriovorax sp. GB3 TaxID=2719615 RepID=UPI002360E1EE|nr:serine hydrolase domain-containing protein [Halobacteriovorax sp. GB3]MDD0853637.1 serine hydrolase [Halobacteriovorax sp. GB3]